VLPRLSERRGAVTSGLRRGVATLRSDCGLARRADSE